MRTQKYRRATGEISFAGRYCAQRMLYDRAVFAEHNNSKLYSWRAFQSIYGL